MKKVGFPKFSIHLFILESKNVGQAANREALLERIK